MASDLSSKIEQFLSKPSTTTWDNVPISENPDLTTSFREQLTAVVDRQRNIPTLQEALRYVVSTVEYLERLPDAFDFSNGKSSSGWRFYEKRNLKRRHRV
jgi:hypothetical protein